MNSVFLKYPSTPGFRNVLKLIKFKDLPTKMTFKQSVKLHGANTSVVLDKDNNLYTQSRNRIITIQNDHMGFSKFVFDNEDLFRKELESLLLNTKASHVVVYGEWCGGSIASKVVIKQLPKMFVIFSIVLVYDNNIDLDSTKELDISNVLSHGSKPFDYPEYKIFNITNFPSPTVEIDFEDPKKALKTLNEMCNEVLKVCPVGLDLGVEGRGEGHVYHSLDNSLRFKIKAEPSYKERQENPSDSLVNKEERLRIQALVGILTPTERLEQGLEYLKEMDKEYSLSNLGIYLQWISTDIKNEDSTLITDSNLPLKGILKECTLLAKDFYITNMPL